jgi:hypothetical protein
MSDHPKKSASDAPACPATSRSHKYSIGSLVEMVGRTDHTSFKITSHLPDSGSGPQYKIKSERESFERVTPEWRLSIHRR